MTSVAAAIPQRRDWLRAPISELAHHGECCERARQWVLARGRSADFSVSSGALHGAPLWLTKQWDWGPTRWPAAWCEIARAEAIDCGVFSALAREIFRSRGIGVHGGQVVRQYDPASLAHYRAKWAAMPEAFQWIDEEHVYHEVCIVRWGADGARVYDPTDGIWLDPAITGGHGGHTAIRAEIPVALRWGKHTLVQGQWLPLR